MRNITSIPVKIKTRDMLKACKNHPHETWDALLTRLIQENTAEQIKTPEKPQTPDPLTLTQEPPRNLEAV